MANRSVPRGPRAPRTTERSRGVASSRESANERTTGTSDRTGTSIELVTTFVPIAGMTCRSCEQRIERNVRRIPNVVQASASAVQARVEIISEGPVPAAVVAEAVEAAGYSVGGTPWLTRDARTWITAGAGLLLIVAIAVVAELTGLLGIASGIGDIREGGLLVALLLGLAAGVSTCMALTGGLVLALSAAYTASRPAIAADMAVVTRLRPHFVFHAGRIAGFAVLGAVLGAVGSTVALPTPLVAALMIAVAVVMTILGTRLTGLSPRIAAWSPTLPVGLSRALGLGEGSVSAYSDLRALALGAATFFLPCGFTQAVQVYALSTGSPLYAGLIMAVFAIGTAPGLLALGGLPALVPARSRPALLQVVGIVVLGFAMVNAMAGLRLIGVTPAIDGGSADGPPPVVEIENGVQTLRTFQLANGYMPANASIYAGMPTRWIVESLDAGSCAIFLQVPSLGVNVTLEKGENAIDLPPLDPGRVTYMCSMGMYVGQLTVVEAPSGASIGAAGG